MDTHLNLSGKSVLVDSLLYIKTVNVLITIFSDGTKNVVPISDHFFIKTI